jgi:hypothetical protein
MSDSPDESKLDEEGYSEAELNKEEERIARYGLPAIYIDT